MSWFRLLLALTTVLVVFGGTHAYLGSRLLELGLLSRATALPLLTGLAVSLLSALLLARTGSAAFPVRLLVWTGFAWMGSILLFLCAALLGHGLTALASKGLLPGTPALWAARLLLGLALLASLWAMLQARRPPAVPEIEVRLPGLPAAFEGYRIAHVTDTHLSTLLDSAWCQDLVDRVNAAHPDLVVHTGDLADGPATALGPAVAPLAGLRAPKLFVTGNHEAYSGLTPWGHKVRELGFVPLTNSHTTLERQGERLVIGGVTDYNQGSFIPQERSDVRRAFLGAPEGLRILLAHQPRSVFQAQDQGIALQLSGHTHGGQIWPFHYLVRLQQPMNAGFRRIGDVLVFTSRGAGFWGPPLRLFAPAEVPILVLRRA